MNINMNMNMNKSDFNKPFNNKDSELYRDTDEYLSHKELFTNKDYLLTGIAIDIVDLAEFKIQSYNEFIESVIEMSNSLYASLTVDYFNKLIEHEEDVQMENYYIIFHNVFLITMKSKNCLVITLTLMVLSRLTTDHIIFVIDKYVEEK